MNCTCPHQDANEPDHDSDCPAGKKVTPELIKSLRTRIAGRREYRASLTYSHAKPGNDSNVLSACRVPCGALEELLDTYEAHTKLKADFATLTEVYGNCNLQAVTYLTERDMATKERIVAAAIHHLGITFSVPAPKRHHHVCHLMHDLGLPIEAQRNQGFITSHGRFVGREEAVTVARAAQQIGSLRKRTDPQAELFSEDLW